MQDSRRGGSLESRPGSDDHRDHRVPRLDLSLKTVTAVADRVKSATVIDRDRRKVVTALVIAEIRGDLGLAQLTELLVVDANLGRVDDGVLHRASPPTGLDA
jgi:hypothetical protein